MTVTLIFQLTPLGLKCYFSINYYYQNLLLWYASNGVLIIFSVDFRWFPFTLSITHVFLWPGFIHFFFLSEFFSQTLTIHRTAGERRGPSFIPLYQFHPLMNIDHIHNITSLLFLDQTEENFFELYILLESFVHIW